MLVPGAGLEPARSCLRGILSPLCLPISPPAPLTWAQRLKRVFEIDITLCPLCGGQLRVIADVTDPDLIRKILDHVNSRAPPRLPPRRAEQHPNLPDLFAER